MESFLSYWLIPALLVFPLLLLISYVFLYLAVYLVVNFFSFFLFRKPLKKHLWITETQGHLYFPYPEDENRQYRWYKANFHMHSDRVLFHYERHSLDTIRKIYRKYGYDIISISDYHTITLLEKHEHYIPVYEWGKNIKKQHFLVINAKRVMPDLFPFLKSPENLQWSIEVLQKTSSFLVLNHPKFWNGFTPELVNKLEGFQAMEVFTPFGEALDFWEKVLSAGKPVFAFSSEDLHLLPANVIEKEIKEPYLKKFIRRVFVKKKKRGGDALRRFILIRSETANKEDILKNLCKGNYVCVKQKSYDQKETFEIKNIVTSQDRFEIAFFHPVEQILFKTKDGMILQEFRNQSEGFLSLQNLNAGFVRVEVWDRRGVLLTNPVMRLNKNISHLCENFR